MNLESLATTSGEWLRGTGPDSDIVISTRIRLARNLGEYPFPPRADDDVRAAVEESLRREIQSLSLGSELEYVDIAQMPALDRQVLVERQLISRELSESHGARGACVRGKMNI